MVSKLEEQIIERVVKARQEARLDRAELAEALSLDENSYGHYERHRSAFTVEQLFQLSRILGKPVTYFLGLDTGLAPDEDDLVHLYRLLPTDRERRRALEALRVQERSAREEVV